MEWQEELISVIVPIYRVEKYLMQCIESIQNQTYRNLQIILVDDGSDDNSPQICDAYAASDPRICVIHKKNGGLDSARKAGMTVAEGKYVGYVDGDDWIAPEMYEKLIGHAKKNKVDVVESGIIESWDGEKNKRVPYLDEGCYKGDAFIKKIEPKLLYTGEFFQSGISVYLCTKLFMKEKIAKYQMMTGKANEIWNSSMVALPCVAETKSLYITHECYYFYRVRSDSLKRNAKRIETADFTECFAMLCDRFLYSTYSIHNQIKYYVLYFALFKHPYLFDDLQSGEFLTPYEKVKRQNKLVLYGAGAAGINLERYIRSVNEKSLVCWADRNYQSLQRTLPVCAPENVVKYDFDYVIIAIFREKAVQSAKKDLINLGISSDKILWIDQKYINNPDLLLDKIFSKTDNDSP